MKINVEKKSNLKYIFQPGDPDLPTLIVLHGYGANAQDLYPIANLRFLKELNFNWIFLQAPHAPQEIATFGGRAWFNVDIEHFQTLVREKRFSEYYSREPEGINKIHDQIETFIQAMRLNPEELIMAGFSQGAMTITDYIYAKKIKPLGLIHLSGTVIRQKEWMAGSLEGIPIFQSHGQSDPVLPVQGAKHFRSISKSKNHQLEVFPGGHEIPMETLLQIKDFLTGLIKTHKGL